MIGGVQTVPAASAISRRSTLLEWNPIATACALGLMHCIIDTASLAILYVQVGLARMAWGDLVAMIVMYNILAFGLQTPLGLISDRFGTHKFFIVLGLAMAGGAVAMPESWPYSSAVVIALGNAMFHVGGGATVLVGCCGRATRPGVFVAPGSMGVAIGLWWGLSGFHYRISLAAVLIACAALVALVRFVPPPASASRCQALPREGCAKLISVLVAILLLLVVAIRSVTGGTVKNWWPEYTGVVAIALAGAAVAGGIMGGFLADRIGWRIVGAGVLLPAGLLLAFAPHDPVVLIIEMLLIQMTMAVTLTGVYLTMPRRPGTAFGLPATVLLTVIIPGVGGYWGIDPVCWLLSLPLIAAAMIFIALTLLGKNRGIT